MHQYPVAVLIRINHCLDRLQGFLLLCIEYIICFICFICSKWR